MNIRAEMNEISCDLSDAVVRCALPIQDANIWDKAGAIGTVLAAVSAVSFGIWAEIKAIRERRRAEKAEAQLRAESAGANIVEAFSELGELKELQKSDLPLRAMGTESLREALGEDDRLARDFVHELGIFELKIIQALEDYIGRDDQGLVSSEAVPLSHAQGVTLRLAAGAMRRGIRAMASAKNEEEKQRALDRFKNVSSSLSEDLKELPLWGE